MKINILTRGFLSPNSRGWLFPIIKNMSRLKKLGVEVSFHFRYSEDIKFCDVVIVESKYVIKDWSINKSKIFDLLKKLKTNTNKVFYYELNDSTFCWALEALPYVDKLLKPFIFRDKSNYCRPLDGYTIISDYYIKNNIINSHEPNSIKNSSYLPIFVKKEDQHYLNKIQVGFNATFADHSSNSILWKYDYFTKINRRFFNLYSKQLKSIKSYEYINPEKKRSKDISCRIQSDGYSEAIAYHRNQTSIIFKDYISTKKLNREDYFSEIRNSKIVLSPFGWGELNLPRDFEVALSGSILLKPDISHIETWPNIFNNKTVVQYKWDLSNLLELANKVINNYDDYIEYAIRLQDQYKSYSFGELGQEKFCNYFINMVQN